MMIKNQLCPTAKALTYKYRKNKVNKLMEFKVKCNLNQF